MTSIGGSMPTYDANGNVLNDFLHTYAWDADGHPTTIDGVLVTYDALDRMVERNNTGTFSEIAYAPDSTKLEIMNSQSGGNAFAPLPGGAMAVWTAGRHNRLLPPSRPPWQFTVRIHLNPHHVLRRALMPSSANLTLKTGSTDLSFTGMNHDRETILDDCASQNLFGCAPLGTPFCANENQPRLLVLGGEVNLLDPLKGRRLNADRLFFAEHASSHGNAEAGCVRKFF